MGKVISFKPNDDHLIERILRRGDEIEQKLYNARPECKVRSIAPLSIDVSGMSSEGKRAILERLMAGPTE